MKEPKLISWCENHRGVYHIFLIKTTTKSKQWFLSFFGLGVEVETHNYQLFRTADGYCFETYPELNHVYSQSNSHEFLHRLFRRVKDKQFEAERVSDYAKLASKLEKINPLLKNL